MRGIERVSCRAKFQHASREEVNSERLISSLSRLSIHTNY